MSDAGTVRWRTLDSYLLVFAASFCTLVVEIVAGRVLAPTLGVSLYTWTTVIGVVLGGVAAGNYAGGLAARRHATPATLGAVLAASGAAVWAVILLVRLVSLDAILASWPPLWRVTGLIGVLFFLPSAMLGTITPLVAQLTLRHRADAGAVVGRLGAIAASGSILGTFLTGFVLTPLLGTQAVLALVAVTLLVLAAYTVWGRWSPARGVRGPLGAALGVLVALAALSGVALFRQENACVRETAYYCIRIEPGSEAGIAYAAMRLDWSIQGFTAPTAPRLLVGQTGQVLADVAIYQVARRGDVPGAPAGASASGGANTASNGSQGPSASEMPFRALFIGGGSYTIPRYLQDVIPQAQLDVMEIDPEVTAVAQERLGLNPSTQIRIDHQDARLAIKRLPSGAYDLVVGDAFHDAAVPWHLTTREFKQQVRRVLRPDGVYVVNVIDAWPDGRFLLAFARTLQEVFPHVALLRVWQDAEGQFANWVVTGSMTPLDASALERQVRPGPRGLEPARARMMDPEQVRRWLARPDALLLTDDFAPVESLLAPRYLER